MSRNKLAGIIIACTIVIIAAILLFHFEPWKQIYTLSVNINPPQAGTVSPEGGTYESGEHVPLTATAYSGYAFDYWDGAATGSSNVVTITIDSDKTVTAHFKPINGVPKELPAGFITWDEAKYHIGERVTVCGPVVDAYYAANSNGKPTFLNIGNRYTDPNRFTVVIWGENRGKFPQAPEAYYLDKTICVTGLLTEYEGIPEIEVEYPSEIQDP